LELVNLDPKVAESVLGNVELAVCHQDLQLWIIPLAACAPEQYELDAKGVA
jgi:hypothetical protein